MHLLFNPLSLNLSSVMMAPRKVSSISVTSIPVDGCRLRGDLDHIAHQRLQVIDRATGTGQHPFVHNSHKCSYSGQFT